MAKEMVTVIARVREMAAAINNDKKKYDKKDKLGNYGE
jgi:hypothetical protein